ncbi:hypothetical protein FO519_001436 [Halicephalobus sp. NKZ332]|nr:hypothetical protein FO519_001436 [Halicephalobus sp. NKZ332]
MDKPVSTNDQPVNSNENEERCLTPPPDIPKEKKYTPALMKVRKTMKEFQVHSPSDSIMSPCTAKLTRKPSKALAEQQDTVQQLSFDD